MRLRIAVIHEKASLGGLSIETSKTMHTEYSSFRHASVVCTIFHSNFILRGNAQKRIPGTRVPGCRNGITRRVG